MPPTLPRARALVLGVAVVGSMAVQVGGTASAEPLAAAPCADPVFVAGQGPSCQVDGGWEVVLGDGTTIFTHGLDAPRSHLWQPPPTPPVAPKCIVNPLRDYHGQVIYARPVDRPNRYASMLGEIRTMVHYANGILDAEAQKFGRSLSQRMRCDANGAVDVVNFTLTTTDAGTTFDTVVTDLRAAGFQNDHAKYWVWVDFAWNRGGQGSIRPDSAPLPSNANNYGQSYALTYGTRHSQGGAAVMAHENGHNLGAVQMTAPHTSGGWHCNDGEDYMCYADGGPLSLRYTSFSCPQLTWDCHNDDYFHPDPPTGSYLATNWNLASPFNRYFEGCAYRNGTLTSPIGATTPPSTLVAVPSTCAGLRYALTGHGLFATPSLALDPGVPDMDVCWYAGTTLIRCDAKPGFEVGTVPASVTNAEIRLRAGTTANFILSVV